MDVALPPVSPPLPGKSHLKPSGTKMFLERLCKRHVCSQGFCSFSHHSYISSGRPFPWIGFFMPFLTTAFSVALSGKSPDLAISVGQDFAIRET